MSLYWLAGQFQTIRSGGLKTLLLKLRVLRYHAPTYVVISGVWAIPMVFVMRLIKPLLHLRLGTVDTRHIGHFVPLAFDWLARIREAPPRSIELFWLRQPTCNSQFERMFRRTFHVYWWVRPLDWWNRRIPGGSAHIRPGKSTVGGRDINGYVFRSDIDIPFTDHEQRIAETWLTTQGWSPGEPFVCLHVRDEAYKLTDGLISLDTLVGKVYQEQNAIRNSDVNTYVDTMMWLVDQGVWVLRMGKVMAKPLPPLSPKIIDYAFLEDKSDLLDMWLFANATFCIGTGSGAESIPLAYKRPVITLNGPAFSHIASYAWCAWVPKHLEWEATGQDLTLDQYIRCPPGTLNDYANLGICVRDLSSNEILEYVQEFWQRIRGEWMDTPEDKDLHSQFWASLRDTNQYSEYHGWIHPHAGPVTKWLRSKQTS